MSGSDALLAQEKGPFLAPWICREWLSCCAERQKALQCAVHFTSILVGNCNLVERDLSPIAPLLPLLQLPLCLAFSRLLRALGGSAATSFGAIGLCRDPCRIAPGGHTANFGFKE